MPKLKILQAIYDLGKGGAEKLAIAATNELNSRQNVEALLISFAKNKVNEYSTENVNYQYCPANVQLSILGKNNLQLNNYINLVQTFQPNVIHSHRYQTEFITREIIFPGIKYFSHIHSFNDQLRNFKIGTLTNKSKLADYFEKKRLMKRYKQCSNKFIAISEAIASYTQPLLNIKPRDIRVIHNAINLKRFTSGQRNEEKKTELITIGNLNPNKGHSFLINVVEQLHQRGLHVTLKIIGADFNNGSYEEGLKKIIANKGLDNYIRFLGNTEKPEDYLKESGIYVHASIKEGFGIALLEGMASGLPVVTTDGGGNRAIMEDGKNGFLIKERNVTQFVDQVQLLIKNQELYSQMSSFAKKYSEQFCIEKYVDNLLDFYGHPVSQGSKQKV